jgi:transposase
MDYHKNARLTVQSREQMAKSVLEGRLMLKQAAAGFNISARTAAPWLGRYRELGAAGLADRSSRPHRLRRPTPPQQVALVETLRRQRGTGRCVR